MLVFSRLPISLVSRQVLSLFYSAVPLLFAIPLITSIAAVSINGQQITPSDVNRATEGRNANGTILPLTAGTPTLVKDITNIGGESQPLNFCEVRSITYFAATDLAHGRELWKTDGTAAGTVLVKDINPGS